MKNKFAYAKKYFFSDKMASKEKGVR